MRWPTTQIRGRIFLPVWLACGVLGAAPISIGESGNQALYSRLEKHGVVVRAVVTRTEPENHDVVYYSFFADGTRHESSAGSDPPNPEASKLVPGERLHVVYDARDPDYSCACDPAQEASSSVSWRRLGAGLFLGTIIALVLTLAIQRSLDRRLSGGGDEPAPSRA